MGEKIDYAVAIVGAFGIILIEMGLFRVRFLAIVSGNLWFVVLIPPIVFLFFYDRLKKKVMENF